MIQALSVPYTYPINTGLQLVVSSNHKNSFEVVPKSIGEVIGEQLVRPLIDYSVRGFQVLKHGAWAIHERVLRASLFPLAAAEPLNPDLASQIERGASCLPLAEETVKLLELVHRAVERKHPNKAATSLLRVVLDSQNRETDCKSLVEEYTQAVNFVRDHLQEVVRDFEAGAIAQLPQEDPIANALIKLFHELTLYKAYKNNSPSGFYTYIWGARSSEPKPEKASFYKFLDAIISNKGKVQFVTSNSWMRSGAGAILAHELKKFLKPTKLDERQEVLVKEEIQRLFDKATENIAWTPAIDFLSDLDAYVNDQLPLDGFISKALHFIDILLYAVKEVTPSSV